MEEVTTMKSSLTLTYQITLRQYAAALELLNNASNDSADIVLMTEPYVTKEDTYPGSRKQHTYAAESAKAVIINRSVKYRLQGSKHTTSNIITVRVSVQPHTSIMLLCVYVPPSKGIEPYIEQLEAVLTKHCTQPIIIVGDFNARSTLWDRITNPKGRRLAEFIEKYSLRLHNQPRINTYETNNGSSVIDLVISNSHQTLGDINVTVVQEFTVSDHYRLVIQVDLTTPVTATTDLLNYNTKKLDLAHLDEYLHRLDLRSVPASTTKDLDDQIEGIHKKLTQYVRLNCKRSQANKSYNNDWWTEELEALRTGFKTLQRTFQRHRRVPSDNYRDKYYDGLITYKKKIREAKRNSWTKMCRERDLWDLPYKIAFKKLKHKPHTDFLKLQDRITDNPDEINAILSTKFFPRDSEPEDTLYHRQTRHHALQVIEPTQQDTSFPSITEMEVQNAVRKMSTNKAPGIDGIPAVFIKRLYHIHPSVVLHLVNEIFRL